MSKGGGLTNRGIAPRVRHSAYEQRAEEHDDAAKAEQRTRVLNFIANEIGTDTVLRLLSFPGGHWRFEHLCEEAFNRRAFYLGLEWKWRVMERGRAWMPTRPTATRPDTPRHERYEVPQVRATIDAYHTQCATWLNMAASTLGWMHNGQVQSRSRRRSWSKQFCRQNAVWLDFTSCIGNEVIEALRRIPAYLDHERARPTPVAVTVLAQREPGSCALSREDTILALLRSSSRAARVDHADSWTYVSESNTPMLTVLARVRAVPPKSSRP